MKSGVQKVIQSAMVGNALTSEEAAIVSERLNRHVNTEFGKSHEKMAIFQYEAQTGCEVVECNESLLEMNFPFIRERTDVNESISLQHSQSQTASQYIYECNVENCAFVGSFEDVKAHELVCQKRSKSKQERIKACGKFHFKIVGMVDGIAEVPFFEENEESQHAYDNLYYQRIVIEVKNRMNSVKVPPP